MRETLYETPRLWTCEEAAQIAELFPDHSYELIEGEIITKSGQRPPHAHVIVALSATLTSLYRGRVRIQAPITLPDPEGLYSIRAQTTSHC